MIGYHMLHGRRSPIQKSRAAADPPAEDNAGPPDSVKGINDSQLGIAVSPLATPILAGPGTIATTMSFVSGAGPDRVLITVAIFAILCVITYFLFVNG